MLQAAAVQFKADEFDIRFGVFHHQYPNQFCDLHYALNPYLQIRKGCPA
jgi:hypothetical protein